LAPPGSALTPYFIFGRRRGAKKIQNLGCTVERVEREGRREEGGGRREAGHTPGGV